MLEFMPVSLWREQLPMFQQAAASMPFPDHLIAQMAILTSLILPKSQVKPALKKVTRRQLDADLSLSRKDCSTLTRQLSSMDHLVPTLSALQALLDEGSWSMLLDASAHAVIMDAVKIPDTPLSMLYGFLGGVGIDSEEAAFFARNLSEKSPVRGFFQMVDRMDGPCRLPKNRQQAAPFFDSFPPDELAVTLLFWFLTWDARTAYSKEFLVMVIVRVKDALTHGKEWNRLVRTLHENELDNLYPQIWAVWKTAGWLESPPNQDFIDAMQWVEYRMSFSSKRKKKSKTATKKKRRWLW